jgi:hypothetical protein
MATREELETALRAADAAGNTVDARVLARALEALGPKTTQGEAAILSAADAATFGTAGKGRALIRTLTNRSVAAPFGEQLRSAMRREHETEEQARADWPKTSVAGTVGGSLLTAPLLPALRGPEAATLGGRLLSGMAQGGTYGAAYGAGSAQSLKDVPERIAEGAGLGLTVGAAVPLAGAGLQRTGQALRNVAAKRAIQALNAPAGEVGKVARPAEVGRALLDTPGVKLRKAAESLRGVSKETGSKVGALTREADATGATFDMAKVAARYESEVVPRLTKDPAGADLAAAGREYISDIANFRSGPTLTPSQAHGWRMDLDTFLRGPTKTGNPQSTFPKTARDQIRGIVDDELRDTMARAGVEREWVLANKAHANIAAARRLATKGEARTQAQDYAGSAPLTMYQQVRGALHLPRAAAARAYDATGKFLGGDKAGMSRGEAQALAARTRAQGGVSYDPVAGKHHGDTGFGVSLRPGDEWNAGKNLTAREVKAYADMVRPEIEADPQTLIGAWKNDSGDWIMDVTNVVQNRADALRRGAAAKQEAIFDFASKDVIPVPKGPVTPKVKTKPISKRTHPKELSRRMLNVMGTRRAVTEPRYAEDK